MKNLLSLFLLMLLPMMAEAYEAKIDGIYYNFDKTAKTATVTYYSSGNFYKENKNAYSGNVNIPPTVDYDGVTYDVTSIGDYAFYYCSGLTSVTIPNSVTSIGQSPFSNCSGLTSIKVENGNTVYDSRNNCNAIIKTETNVLIVGCKYTAIPNSVTSIGDYAFSGCSGLTYATIPNSVTSIGDYAFSDCSSLPSIKIPNSVTSIGYSAFMRCSGLTSVTSLIQEPFEIDEDVFQYYDKGYKFTSATLYVPNGTKKKYEAVPAWNKFKTIVEMEEQCAKPTIIIAGKGMRYECETPGAEFESILTMEEQRFTGNKLVMENKDLVYILTVYAIAPGYDRSEPAQVRFIVSRNDVNQDGTIDVADIATIIDAMAD